MCVYTVRAHKFSAFKAEACLSALLSAITAADLASITTFLYGEKAHQTILERTVRQRIEAIRDANLRLTLRTAKFSIFLGS